MEELYREGMELRVLTDARAADEARQVVGGQPHARLGTAWRSATAVFKTRENTPVYRLVTAHGYEVTATPDHRFLTPAGYVELKDLEPGDVLYLQSGAGGWSEEAALPPIAYSGNGASRLRNRAADGTAMPPTTWSREVGHLLGWLSGDGYVYRHGDHGRVNLLFGRDEGELLPYFRGLLRGWFGVDGVANTRHSTTNLSYEGVPAAFAEALGARPGKAHEKRVPESIWRAPREAVVGYLQALFTSDGTVNVSCYKKSCSIRLASSSEDLLKDVQLLLLNLGLVSRLYRRREARTHLLPGADREMRAYETKAQFELILDKINRDRFLDEIGFLTAAKQERGRAYVESKSRLSNREIFVTRVAHVEAAGAADVFDLTEPDTHSVVVNGLVAHQCGEQGIAPWSVCNLAALNLSSFVEEGRMDYERLAEYTRIGMRFSDNVIDANLYFFEENAQEQLGTRRTGLGTMGLADALIKMGVRYGSPESEAVIGQIYRTIRDAAYDASVDLAIEKGPFGRFDREKYMQGRFIQQLPAELQARIAEHGIRNAVILTQAPTGTTSLVAGVSSGIEPVFDFAYRRVDRTGESIIYHPLLEAWMQANPGAERPDYFVGANDLTPEDHIRVQAIVQQYTDSSISKTCNAPNDHTVEDVERLYRLAYDMGCKGVTYYRDGSRDAVLHHIEKKEEKPAATPAPAPIPAPVVDKTIRQRPPVVHGYTRNMRAPEGTVNITLNSDDAGLLEVFVNVGRAGSDIAALAEALGRLIGIALRVPSPMTPDERAREMVNQLRGIGGSRTVGFGLEQVRSLPDAIGLAMQKHLEGQTAAAPARPTVSQPVLPGLQPGAQLTGNLCPECGSTTAFVFEEGCKKCHACGHSEC
jgi:ribonucleoside-diphosphate reductase alpha chain